MKRFLAVLLCLLPIQAGTQDQKTAFYAVAFDADSSTLTTCVAANRSGDPWGEPNPGIGLTGARVKVKTTGSSTTVTEVTAGSQPFADLAVGDLLFIDDEPGKTRFIRRIVTKTSNITVVLDSALNIENGGSGRGFSWREVTCGTAATDGWIYVKPYLHKILSIHVDQMNATSVDVKWECKHDNGFSNPVNVYPGTVTTALDPLVCPGGSTSSNRCQYTAASQNTRTDLEIDMPYDYCRPLFAVNTDDGGDTGVDAESITAFITVWGAK